MEKSEPSLMPEWLKVNGSGGVGGGFSHRTAFSSFHSDDRSQSRNKPSGTKNRHQSGHSSVPDRSNSRRNSGGNGSASSRFPSSFGRNNQRRDWDKGFHSSYGTEKSSWGRNGRREISNPSEINSPTRYEKDLRRSQSIVTDKRGEILPSKLSSESSNAKEGPKKDSNSLAAGLNDVPVVNATVFERDFPSLGTDEKQVASDIARASSPGSSTAIKSLSVDTSAVNGADLWASALAKGPALVCNNGAAVSIQQVVPPHSVSSTTAGPNIAETLTRGPFRASSTNQISDDASRLEELAIKKCRQLIPVTPSMPKALGQNLLEKPKLRHGQQDQITKLQLTNQTSRGASATSDDSKGSTVAKFHVLKSERERNGLLPGSKEILSPASVSRDATGPVPVAGSAPLRSASSNPNHASLMRRTGLVTLEKRPSPQAKSRNDFFNLVRKKSLTVPSSTDHDPELVSSPTVLVKSAGNETCNDPGMPRNGDSLSSDNLIDVHPAETKNDVDDNGNAFIKPQEFCNDKNQEPVDNGKVHSTSKAILYSEEEETALLRLLGWEEDAEDDGGLTEEEISSFYKELDEYLKLRPQPKFMVALNLRTGGVGIKAASGSS